MIALVAEEVAWAALASPKCPNQARVRHWLPITAMITPRSMTEGPIPATPGVAVRT
jgi:hypothetical protein